MRFVRLHISTASLTMSAVVTVLQCRGQIVAMLRPWVVSLPKHLRSMYEVCTYNTPLLVAGSTVRGLLSVVCPNFPLQCGSAVIQREAERHFDKPKGQCLHKRMHRLDANAGIKL